MYSKRLFDIVLSVALIILLSPLLLIVYVLIKASSNGPAFFLQERLGLNGSVFRMYKFRSMVVNAEQQGTGLFSYNDDPRITPVGRIIRRTSIDELPQLFNILIGDMSLVGPRPPVTYELGKFSDFDSELRKRFTVKPGLTGLAQISGRNDLSWPEKVKYDNKYIDEYKKYGLFLDFKIILKTVFVVLSMSSTIEKK